MVSLANLYRPKKFDDVVGQNSVIKILKRQVETGNIKNGYLFCGNTGSGKAQPLYSLVLTPSGFKKMGDIHVGDTVVSGDGEETTVLGTFPQGKKPTYRISFQDGTHIDVADDHLNCVYFTTTNNEELVMTTKELVSVYNNSKQPICVPITTVNCWSNNKLLIDPYLLGVLIGDGGLTGGNLNVTLNYSSSPDLLKTVESLLNDIGLTLVRASKDERKKYAFIIHCKDRGKIKYYFSYKNYKNLQADELRELLIAEGFDKISTDTIKAIALGSGYRNTKVGGKNKYKELMGKISVTVDNSYDIKKNWFTNELTRLGLRCKSIDKHIPEEYLFTTYENRLSLLQGLMDTDGEIGGRTFSTSSKKLAEDVAFLARSLGMVVTVTTREPSYVNKKTGERVKCNTSYRMYFRFRNDVLPFKTKKIIDSFVPFQHLPHKKIVDIKYIGDVECQCIYVSSDSHTYITDGFAVTHNTTCAKIFAREINGGLGHPIEIDAASNNGVDNVRNIIQEASERSLVGKYKTIIIDEAQAITPAGWGAFLKSIEETPEYTIYIFCTTDPQKIPPTILNRVQRFNFNKIGYDDIFERLRFVCDQEGFRNYYETISYIAKTCNGCMREALTLLGKVADGGIDFNINNTIEILGDIPYENYFGLLNAIIDGNEKNILSILDNIDNMGIDYRTFVSKLLKTIIDIEKYIIFGTMDVTSIPITYEKNVKYATNFDSPLKYYNYYMDKMLELKSKLVNDDDVPTTVRVVCLQMARMQ